MCVLVSSGGFWFALLCSGVLWWALVNSGKLWWALVNSGEFCGFWRVLVHCGQF